MHQINLIKEKHFGNDMFFPKDNDLLARICIAMRKTNSHGTRRSLNQANVDDLRDLGVEVNIDYGTSFRE